MADLHVSESMLAFNRALKARHVIVLWVVLLLTLSSPAFANTFVIKVGAVGPGRVSACDGSRVKGGKVKVEEGQSVCLSMQPLSAAFATKDVRVDGKSVGSLTEYTFPAIHDNHHLKAVFVRKKIDILTANLNPSGGKLLPRKSIKIAYGLSQTFFANPKKGYFAALRVDGVEQARGKANKPVRYRLRKIEAPHKVEVQFLKFDPTPKPLAAVTVNVTASDPNGWPLHYQWRVSEGSIDNIDAPSTTWRLPPGPGVHFANVLVSNEHGSYEERRIAVISDELGFAAPAVSPRDFEPPALPVKQFFNDAEFLVVNQPGTSRTVYVPDVAANYDDVFNGLSVRTQTDGYGWLSYFNFDHCVDYYCDGGNGGHPHLHELLYDLTSPLNPKPPVEYVVGSARLSDDRPCGAENPFQGVHATATAQLLNNAQQPLDDKVKANVYGDYAIKWNSQAAFVRVECEAAAPVVVAIDTLSRVADKAVFVGSGAPLVTGMSASYEWPDIGIFLPPELGQPSDKFSNTDRFLAFKGIDTVNSACEYYRVIGAVQSCDAQGTPSGAITFDDWKRKMGMEPYVRAGGQEIQATYINRIDLNLTRNHHAITYRNDASQQLSKLSAGGIHNCALRADDSLVCWGSNDAGESSPPTGKFTQISAGMGYACALKADKSVTCWGGGSLAQVVTPTGSFTQISVGTYFACAVSDGGKLACWGDQGLVDATPGSGVYSQVSVGDAHACALRQNDGRLVCWESVSAGQTSEPTGPVKGPNGDTANYRQVSAGGSNTCGLTQNGSIKCWTYTSSVPITPASGTYSQVTVGSSHACALKTDGTAVCQGSNDFGQIAAPPGTFTLLSAGSMHTCALATDGSIKCWGDYYGNKTNPPDYLHRSAAYVCNHLGPKSDSQADVDAAIASAVAGENQVACVAMDYGYASANGNPYVRYFTFAPNGQLLLSLNLDGRAEKFMPGVCVACHGGDKYDVRFPVPTSGDSRVGSPDYGGHFLPWDIGNFEFSTQPGLTKADQQAAIHQLNQMVLTTNPTLIERNLINGWYAAGTDVQDEAYLPADWKVVDGKVPGLDGAAEKLYKANLYEKVYARYCRTCHVALTRDGSGTSTTDNPDIWENWTDSAFPQTICGGSRSINRNHTMPNSLRTFDLFWNDATARSLLAQLFPGECLNRPDPELAQPIPETLVKGSSKVLSGEAASQKFFAITVPAGKALTIALDPDPNAVSPGNASLYVRKGALPSEYVNDCIPETAGCRQFAASTSAAVYYLVVFGDSAYSNWTLSVNYP